jgi:hypothetical protein
VKDYKLYDNGQPKAVGWLAVLPDQDMSFGQNVDFFEDGHIKSVRWMLNQRPVTGLDFYSSGQLKAEEYYSSGKIEHAIYYGSQGNIESTVGERLSWATDRGF